MPCPPAARVDCSLSCCASVRGSCRVKSVSSRAVLERRHPSPRGRQPYFSPLGTTDENPACLPSGEAPSRGVLVLPRGVKTTELDAGYEKDHEAYTRRKPGGWGRCPASLARRRADEDHARTQRWPATAESSLPRRSRLVRRCGRIGKKWTTRTPGGPDSTPRGPPCHGEYPARTSSTWEVRTATASEGR